MSKKINIAIKCEYLIRIIAFIQVDIIVQQLCVNKLTLLETHFNRNQLIVNQLY